MVSWACAEMDEMDDAQGKDGWKGVRGDGEMICAKMDEMGGCRRMRCMEGCERKQREECQLQWVSNR